ncbi:hypothetical protein ADK55_27610 [Streptomyces sp. WM4235]|nr:hypothetical protein ADK55_27610 [Streptomyces sp. WM4235]
MRALFLVRLRSTPSCRPMPLGEDPGLFEVADALCTALAIGAPVYAIIEGNERGWTKPEVVIALSVTGLAFAAYADLGLSTDQPLLAVASPPTGGFPAPGPAHVPGPRIYDDCLPSRSNRLAMKSPQAGDRTTNMLMRIRSSSFPSCRRSRGPRMP